MKAEKFSSSIFLLAFPRSSWTKPSPINIQHKMRNWLLKISNYTAVGRTLILVLQRYFYWCNFFLIYFFIFCLKNQICKTCSVGNKNQKGVSMLQYTYSQLVLKADLGRANSLNVHSPADAGIPKILSSDSYWKKYFSVRVLFLLIF